ncbi:MAG TPA: 2-C-methyl-D-erythritol 4-phosphate cytidylyltransferase [Candidatus Limnocylindria bacterium]|jgi:2-C-methyl-D-erythritol 4-phosphate cytidylyltransferase
MTAGLAILAAGSSTRAGADKVSADLGGRPVLAWSIAAAIASGAFAEILVVAPVGREPAVRALVAEYAVRVIPGGASRTASSWAALAALVTHDVIAIHDAARPFTAPSLFARLVAEAAEHGSAVPGLAVADTVRRADAGGRSLEEVDRSGLTLVQTPQVFRRPVLERARAAAGDRTFTDDAAAVIASGQEARLVQGDRRNLKLTTMEDLGYARELVAKGLAAIHATVVTRS